MTGLPRLNEPAPDFHARTTHGDRSLADYRGRWLILFSHPSDFTPVCTTEFIGFAKHANEFAAMNAVYARFFETNPPARSTVEVARLPRDSRVEIECIAIVDTE